MKLYIIEDQEETVSFLKNTIVKHIPDAEIVGSGDHVEKTIDALRTLKPDLLLCDILLSGGNNVFQILNETNDLGYKIIFITITNSFALEVFRSNAINFIQKPINSDLLIQTIQSINFENNEKIERLFDVEKKITSIYRCLSSNKKIPVYNNGVYTILKADEVILIEAEGAYSKIVLLNKKTILISKNISSLSESFDSEIFTRIHRSFIINLMHIREIKNTHNGAELITSDDQHININRETRNIILEKIAQTDS